MKQNREHGKKKLAARCTSIILALVFVFSIFSGIASGGDCKVVEETILGVVIHPKEDSIQCQFISSTCEQSTWKRTTTKKHDLETKYARTYSCYCENTGQWEIDPIPRIESKWVYDISDDPVIDSLTGGATCPKPCLTQEQYDAAAKNVIYWDYRVFYFEAQFAGVVLLAAALTAAMARIGNPILGALLGAAMILKAQQSLDNAKSSRDAAHERFDELCKLPACYPKAQRPEGCD